MHFENPRCNAFRKPPLQCISRHAVAMHFETCRCNAFRDTSLQCVSELTEE